MTDNTLAREIILKIAAFILRPLVWPFGYTVEYRRVCRIPARYMGG